MRVIYVCLDGGIPVFGTKGASVHVQELLRAYRALGHEVVLVAARLGGDPPVDLRDVELHELGRPQGATTRARERAALTSDARAERLLSALGPADLVHERYSLFGGAGVRVAADRGDRSVLEVNAPLIDEQLTHRTLVHRDLVEGRLRAQVAAATAITAVSEPVASWLVARTGRRPVHVVPNGVDPTRFAAPRPPAPGRFVVGFVGTLKPWHGVEGLVDAVAALRVDVPYARLSLVGDGPRRDAIERRAAEAEVPLRCTGAVPPAAVPHLLSGMDVAVAPYPGGPGASYFSPLKVLEYLAAGLPVVASATGQVPQLLAGGSVGRLVPPGDADALCAALAALHDAPQLRRDLGAAGRRHVATHHTWSQVVGATLGHVETEAASSLGVRT